jgi:hypothetical protein
MSGKLARMGTAALVAVLSLACGHADRLLAPTALTELCPVQSLACFDAKTTLSIDGQSVETRVTSEDLPLPGWLNRWHYRFGPEADPLLAPLVDQWRTTPICGAAIVWPSGQGGMWQHAHGAWRLDMRPTDPNVAAQFAALAGANECRTQPWTVLRVDGRLEILIAESAP